MLGQVNEALKSLHVDDTDGAAVELARVYARELDDGAEAHKVGPLLLAALESLGMTPRSRAALKGGARDIATSPLDELRKRRRARLDNAEAVDTAPA